jgi:hypothetical protein
MSIICLLLMSIMLFVADSVMLFVADALLVFARCCCPSELLVAVFLHGR